MNKIAWSIPLRIFPNIESQINKHFKFIIKTNINNFLILPHRGPLKFIIWVVFAHGYLIAQ